MMKYFLGILSTLLSLLLGTAALADTLTGTLSTDAIYSVKVLNLPLLQEPNKTFTFTLAVSSDFTGEPQQATLYVDDCGDDLAVSYQGKIRMSIPLTLAPQGKHEFPLTLYRASNEECILTFRLLDAENALLASTQVGVLPQCPNERAKKPIDEGLDYNLPEIIAQNGHSDEPAVAGEEESSIKKNPSPLDASLQPTASTQHDGLLNYTTSELQSAFDLLVEKGLLTTGDQTKLQQPLTRIAAAEVFVDIALSNDLPLDSKKPCTFPDMQSYSTDEINIATLACQLNIMGVNPDYTQLDNFMPSTVIPSEQLITAFSRLMWRDLYEAPESGDYYELHFNTMFNLGLVDTKVIKADSKWADFVVIAARAFEKEQLTLENLEQIDLECETGDAVAADCEKEKEKKSFRPW